MSLTTTDDILRKIGSFNGYQWRLMGLLAYCMTCMGLQGLTMAFIADDPGWKCFGNTTSCNHTGIVTTTMPNYKDRCTMDRKDWIFPDSSSSIVTEFELVCDRSILKNIATSMVYLGWLIGAIVYGFVSDRWGRKKVLLISMTLMAIAGLVSSFVKLLWLFCLLQVIVGSGIGGGSMCIFILITEFVGPKHRAFAGIFVWNFFTVGVSLVALIGYLVSSWKHFNMATSAPGFLIIILYQFLPESIRWLIVNNKTDQVEQTLKDIAKVNGKTFPTNIKLNNHKFDASNEGGNVLELFKHRPLAIYTLVLLFVWMSAAMGFFGISLSSGKIGGNIYLVFFLTNIVAIPANFSAAATIDRFGRKRVMIVTLYISAAAMLSAALLPANDNDYVPAKVTLSMIAMFNNIIAFNAVYIITFELMPTTLRHVGMGLSSSVARIGSFMASYVTYLAQIKPILPFIVIGLFAVISGSLTFILPETKGKPTIETIKDEKKSNDSVEMKMVNAQA